MTMTIWRTNKPYIYITSFLKKQILTNKKYKRVLGDISLEIEACQFYQWWCPECSVPRIAIPNSSTLVVLLVVCHNQAADRLMFDAKSGKDS